MCDLEATFSSWELLEALIVEVSLNIFNFLNYNLGEAVIY